MSFENPYQNINSQKTEEKKPEEPKNPEPKQEAPPVSESPQRPPENLNESTESPKENQEFTKFLKDKYFGVSKENGETIENKENQEEKLIEYSQKFGDFYTSLMEQMIKTGELKEEMLNELPDATKGKIKDFMGSIDKNIQLQQVRLSLKEKGAQDLLSELAERRQVNKDLLNDQSKYELKEMSPGIFVIFMDKDLYSKLHGESVAVATLKKEGVSFISMPKEYKEEKFRDNLYKENLLHETHHIVWSFLLKDKKINIKEENDDMWNAYRFFQDEVLARLCSGGGPMGYSHLLMMDKESLKEFKKEEPEKEKEINQNVMKLNTLMYDEILPLIGEAGLKKQDLIFSVEESENFAELENNLKKIKSAIEQKAEEMKRSKPKVESSGWDVAG